jgi:hypothetical protein
VRPFSRSDVPPPAGRLAEPSGAADVLQRYFAQRGIRIVPDDDARQDTA